MKHTLTGRVVPVLVGAAVVAAGVNVATYAADGHPFLLGSANSESHPATLTNSGNGPALTLRSGAASAPLAVSSSHLVKNLNADTVDGLSASALQTDATTWTIPAGTTLAYQLKGLDAGTYLATFDITLNASGTARCQLQETGGPVSVLSYGANLAGAASVTNGVGIVAHHAGKTVTLSCDQASQISAGVPSTVTLVRLAHVSQGSVAAAP